MSHLGSKYIDLQRDLDLWQVLPNKNQKHVHKSFSQKPGNYQVYGTKRHQEANRPESMLLQQILIINK